VADGDRPDAHQVWGMNIWRRCMQHLEIGARRPLLVRRERLPHLGLGKRILFASDLHLRKDGPRHIVDGILDIVSQEQPDIILLGGDLVDWGTALETLHDLIGSMAQELASGTRWPEWKPGSEFKALRDKSGAVRR